MNVVESNLATCDALAAFLHEGFITSRWCDQEVGFALCRSTLILPIVIDVDPYGFMGRYQGLRVHHLSPEAVAKKVYETLRDNPKTSEVVQRGYTANHTENTVRLFEKSASFAATRRNYKLLESLTDWTWDLLDRVSEASRTNSQISRETLMNVPAKVATLVSDKRRNLDELPS
jgi:hypothetical protein